MKPKGLVKEVLFLKELDLDSVGPLDTWQKEIAKKQHCYFKLPRWLYLNTAGQEIYLIHTTCYYYYYSEIKTKNKKVLQKGNYYITEDW